jgi:nitroreductase
MNAHLLPWQISADEFPADGSAADQLEFLLGYAILAPSPHNTQPWLFRLNAKDVEIFADPRRALNVADPEGRELAISCGALVFNLKVAVEHFGHQYQVKIEPDPGNPDLLVRFQLDLHGAADSEEVLLFNALTRRRTCRKAFRDQPVPQELVEAWTAAAARHGAWLAVAQEEPARLALAELVAGADRIQWSDKRFRAELANWSRSKPFERGDGFPATELGVNEWLAFAGPMLLRTFDRGGGQAATDREIALHSPVLAVLGTDADNARSWIDAGQALENVLLIASAEEVQASFLNQPIEVAEIRPRLAESIGRTGFPQVLIRLGYGPEAAPTPRRAVRRLLVPHHGAHD